MLQSSISDQKRAVRALQWEHARKVLRVRDKAHHRAWKLLTIAGPAPHEEITCIRELMHQAHIISVDVEAANLEAAIEAGTNEVIHCDIGDFHEDVQPGRKYENGYVAPDKITLEPPMSIMVAAPFDAICLDLTGPADDWLKQVVQVYFRTGVISKGGVLIVTFSYGRDVVEVYDDEWERVCADDRSAEFKSFRPSKELDHIPELVASRVWYLLRARCDYLSSCLQYRGGMMPMVSCLLRKGPVTSIDFEQLAPLDYELLVAEDVGKIYACPAEKLEAIRQRYNRKEAARKAVETKRLRELKKHPPQLRLVEPPAQLPPPPSHLAQMEKIWQDCTDEERAEVWKMFHKIYLERSERENLTAVDSQARAGLLALINEAKTPNSVTISGPTHDASCLCVACCIKRKKANSGAA